MKFSHSPVLERSVPAWRARLMLLLLLTGFASLLGRAVWLQGFNREFLQGEGEARYERVLEIPATRGRITDRHGMMLAVSTPVKSIWAIPDDAHLQPAQARELARLLGVDLRELNRKLGSDRDFVFVKRQIEPTVAERVDAMHFPGIHMQEEYRRYYPGAETSAHLLGFTGADDAGQEGVELAFNAALSGRSGSRRVIRDRRGNIVEDVESIRPPQEGRDLTLAIDDKLQYLAYSNLKQAVEAQRAKAGSIVVLDVRTGEVLALSDIPTYNPNNRERLSGAQLRNRALTDSFEPGSTMKPFTVALALDQGKYRPDTLIETGQGQFNVGNATIHDSHPNGTLTVAQVIQKSSNVGAARMALSLPAESMWKMFDQLGFGASLKMGFPGEVGGRLRPWQHWQPIEQATMAYGHGISVTLMQLARAYLVFARAGDLIPLALTRVDAGPPPARRVFSEQTTRALRAMLETVVEPGGTAPKAQIPGYRVAGKTGTAHKLEGGGYVNKYVASFVGFAPASDPRLIVAVMIDEPSNGLYYGGDVAAPVFARVMAGALRTLGVAQDAPLRPVQVADAPQAREEM